MPTRKRLSKRPGARIEKPYAVPTPAEEKRIELETHLLCAVCIRPVECPRLCPHCSCAACEKCFFTHSVDGINSGSTQDMCIVCNQHVTPEQLWKCPWLVPLAAEMLHLKILLRNEKFMLKKRIENGLTINPPPIPQEEIDARFHSVL